MILEVDFGNTRLKWRILDSVTLACIDRGAVLQILGLLPALHAKGYYRFVFCRVCSVRGCADNVCRPLSGCGSTSGTSTIAVGCIAADS